MSEEKIGKWFVADRKGCVFGSYDTERAAYEGSMQLAKGYPKDNPHRVIYMVETEVPKPKEQECPELQVGDVIRISDIPCGFLLLKLNVSKAQSGHAVHRLLRLGVPHGYADAFTDVLDSCLGCSRLYRNGQQIWWKGKLED